MKHIVLEIVALIVSSALSSIIFWLVTPEKMIEARIIVPILIIILIILYGAIKYIFQLKEDLNNNNQIKLPKLKTIEDGFYIFEASEIFEPQSYCVIYKIDKTKKKISAGIVDTIIDSSCLIQVKLFENIDNISKMELLKQKKNIYLKPVITKSEIDKLQNYKTIGDDDEQ